MRSRLVAAVLVVLAARASPADGQAPPPGIAPDREMVDVVVEPDDSCESIAERLYGHPRYYFVVAAHLPGMRGVLRLACDRALSPGTTLRLPRRATEGSDGPDATVSAVRRRVRSRPPDGEDWRSARVGEELLRGGRVATLERSTAELTFRDRSRVLLRERSLIVVHGASGAAARRTSSRARLEHGTLRSRLDELTGRAALRVETETARAELLRGEALVGVDGESVTTVANHRGEPATVSTPDGRGRVRVYPGTGTTVRRGGLPTRPRPLPPAPAWSEDEPSLFVGIDGLGATAWGSFRPSGPAQAHVVEVVGGEGERLVEAVRVPAKVRRFELQRLGAGAHWVRVSSVDSDGLESPPSTPRTLHVVLLDAVPAVRREDDDDEHDETVRLYSGSRLVAPPGVSCKVGEGAPARRLLLAGEGPVAVRCAARDGRRAPDLEVELVPLAVRVVGRGEDGPLELVRGQRQRVELELTGRAPVPADLSALGSPGLELEVAAAAGRLVLDLRAGPDAPRESRLEVVAPGGPETGVLASLQVLVTEETEEPEVELSAGPSIEARPPESPFAGPGVPHEGSSLLLQRGTFGVRDERRAGTGAFVALGWVGRRGGEGRQDRFVLTGGIRAGLLDERARLEMALDVGDDARPGGGWVALSSRLLAGPRVGLAVELGAWAPLREDDGETLPVRILPSADLSVSLGPRVVLRSRQGAAVDAASDGLRAWSSAYGVDVRAIGPLAVGAEAVLVVGVDPSGVVAAPALAAGLSARLGLAVVSATGRLAFGEHANALLGRYAVLATVRLSSASSP